MTKLQSASNDTKQELEALAAEVHKAFVTAGVAQPMGCRTECSISIGPDGKPVYTCRVVCDF